MDIKKSELRRLIRESINEIVNESRYLDFKDVWQIYENLKEIANIENLCDDFARWLGGDGLRKFLENYDRLEPGLGLFKGYDDSLYDEDELEDGE